MPTRRRRPSRRGSGGRAPTKRARKPPPKGGRLDEARAAIEGFEQRHYDLIGLALIAVAVYLAFVLYLGWNGGRVGGWTDTGLADVAGRVAYVVPVALAGLGIALIMRPSLKAPAALNAGGILVILALMLAFAAGTLSLGPDHPVRHGYFHPAFFRVHGGAVGEGLYWASTTLFQRLGAQILAVLMFVSGALLLTGSTIGSLLSGARRAAQGAGRGTRDLARTVRLQNLGIEGFGEPEGHDIAITRLDDTAPLATEVLVSDDEPSRIDEAPTDDWDDEVVDEPDFDSEPPDEVPDEPEADLTPMGNLRSAVTESEEIEYRPPVPQKLLERGKPDTGPDTRDRDAVAKSLLEALQHFGVQARLLGVVSGPHVSRYELQLAPGTKVAKVAQLKDDLAYALASTDIRILAPIPGKKAVGVEVPNSRRRMVRLGDIYDGRPKGSTPLAVWLGKDVSGQAVSTDLADMPHALVAGTTGSGKSGCINAMLCSILLHASPNDVRLVLVDPKRVELNHYAKLPHLLTPVVTNPRMAANVLANLINEMESRYEVMEIARARNLVELNRARKRAGEPPLPQILCVIDELADLMMIAPADVEDSIIRLAQKSRAVGIHLVLATQRPSTDVITGTIKVNIPARIAFGVASQVDSRVILDAGGAESLLGKGDMLFRPVGTSRLDRIQGAFVTEEEIARIVKHWARQGEPEFDEALLEAKDESGPEERDGEFSPDQDDLLEEAARVVVESGTASVSMIQRRLRVGYTRAGRLIDMLERRGVISGYEGSKARQVLVGHAELARLMAGDPPAQDEGVPQGEVSEGEGPGGDLEPQTAEISSSS